jgi:hypothetical protein
MGVEEDYEKKEKRWSKSISINIIRSIGVNIGINDS